MKIKSALLVLLTMVIFSGCGDDDEKAAYKCSSCVDSPEALPANDDSGKGIYKGVVIGSSGTLKINMDNEGNGIISATLVLDEEVIELDTEGSYNSEGGFEGYFYNNNDTETQEDDFRIGFSVNSTGTSYELFGISFPSPHNDVTIAVVKETSDALIRVFEGTFKGDDKGTWNLVMMIDEDGDGQCAGIGRSDSGDESYFEGEIQNMVLVGEGDATVEGTVDGDTLEGTWETDESSGTWKGKRTL